MNIYEKIRAYRELCGVTQQEVKELGEYTKSVAYYGQCENGKWELDEERINEMYTCISRARAVKQQRKIESDK